MTVQPSNSAWCTTTLNIDGELIPISWLLLDNQSTVDVISNPKLPQDIQQVKGSLRINTQAGTPCTNWRGHFRRHGWVWHCPNGMANILSRFRVTFDSGADNQFHVHKDDGLLRCFRQSAGGLHHNDLTERSEALFVNTAANNKSKCTNEDHLRALNARALHKRAGRPSPRRFIRMLERQELCNCPVTKEDALMAEDTFGPDAARSCPDRSSPYPRHHCGQAQERDTRRQHHESEQDSIRDHN